MYHPVWKEHFSSCFDIKDGQFIIDKHDKAVKKHLLMQINDNVYKNIDRFSVLLFDESSRLKKQQISDKERERIVDKLLTESNPVELVDRAVDKILLTHRNTRLFLFMMTGPFLIMFQTVKYIIKGAIFFYFYRKAK
jgi:hypothetical protein